LCITAGLKKLNKHTWYPSYTEQSKGSQEVTVLYTERFDKDITHKALMTRRN
jgi:hypothetical protein